MKALGTLIRRSPLTETSLIVHWCTHENGIVKTVAKGARRPKSLFSGKLDLFYRCEVEIHPAKKGDLHILKDLTLQSPRLGLRRNYQQTLAASYFVKLGDSVDELDEVGSSQGFAGTTSKPWLLPTSSSSSTESPNRKPRSLKSLTC